MGLVSKHELFLQVCTCVLVVNISRHSDGTLHMAGGGVFGPFLWQHEPQFHAQTVPGQRTNH